MWPFGKRAKAAVAKAIVGIRVPTAVDIMATVASVDHVTSPISGLQGAAVQIELFEKHQTSIREHRERLLAGNYGDWPDEDDLGVAVLGGVLLLRAEDDAHVSVTLRECVIASPTAPPKQALRTLLPELVPLFRQPEGEGTLWFREIALTHGDRVRLRAVVSPSQGRPPTAYRSAAEAGFETRDDLGAVRLTRLA